MFEVWQEKNWIILGWIQASVGPLMNSLVMNHHMTHEFWIAMETHLSLWKMIHSQSIRDQLRNLKKIDEMTMNDYLI